MKKPRYAGDARMRKLLERYACPTPFHVVRAMMMGNMASPLMASPMQLIQSLWNDELPKFETEQEAEAFFGELLGLWNHLGRHQSRSQPFKLMGSRPPADRDGLEDHCRMHFEELAALLDGFFQRED